MRITPTKLLNAVTLAILLVLLWTACKQYYGGDNRSAFTDTCDVSEEYRTSLDNLVYATHDVLDSLDLVHFLCYGSLFGQVRQAASLSWERDAEYCVLNEDFSKHDEGFLKRAFSKGGLDISYDSWEGMYRITEGRRRSSARLEEEDERPLFEGFVQLVVFAKDKEISVSHEMMYHRVGLKRRMLPPDCAYSTMLECFPARLAERPLPLKLFGTRAVPVPREEFEILKYHFPDNWWREEKPLNC